MTRAGAGNQEDLEELEAQILRCFEDGQAAVSDEAETAVTALMDALTRGVVRSARRVGDEWQAVEWVKTGILLAFRIGQVREFPAAPAPFSIRTRCLCVKPGASRRTSVSCRVVPRSGPAPSWPRT